MNPASLKIENCYDSHVHWLATGAFSERISLKDLNEPKDILSLSPPSGSEWILGYGWNFETTSLSRADRHLLDQWCADRPVALSRGDGHGMWVNSKALDLVGLMNLEPVMDLKFSKELCPLGDDGFPTGLLYEDARDVVIKASKVKKESEVLRQLIKAQKIFHSYGITHIRDVGMNPFQLQQAMQLESSGLLKLAVECFFYEEEVSHSKLIELALSAQKEKSDLLRVRGVKVFVDGSLGSETAYLSQGYQSGSGVGWVKYKEEELTEIIRDIWNADLEVAVHTIGDEAVHMAARSAVRVTESGVRGQIHFEHAEMIREETFPLLSSLDCAIHFQPSHWLSDKKWLKDKIKPELLSTLFRWRKIQELEIPFYFGSDSPMGAPSPLISREAIEDSLTQGIPRLLGEAETHHTHPDSSWVPNTFTVYSEGKVDHIVFSGEHL